MAEWVGRFAATLHSDDRALILAIRAGLKDSRQDGCLISGTSLPGGAHRKDLLQRGGRTLVALYHGVRVDVVYQLIVARWIYPLET